MPSAEGVYSAHRLRGYYEKWTDENGASPNDFVIELRSAESFERAVEFWFQMFEPHGAYANYGAQADQDTLLEALCEAVATRVIDDPVRAARAVMRVQASGFVRHYD